MFCQDICISQSLFAPAGGEVVSKFTVALQRLQLPSLACALSAVVLTFILF